MNDFDYCLQSTYLHVFAVLNTNIDWRSSMEKSRVPHTIAESFIKHLDRGNATRIIWEIWVTATEQKDTKILTS